MIAGAVRDKDYSSYAVEFPDGTHRVCGQGPYAFSIALAGEEQLDWFTKADPYSVALAFIRGEFSVRGDLVSAIRLKQAGYRPGWRGALLTALAGFAPGRLENWFQSRRRAARDIRFHYDRSNDFYRQFLDSRLQYSEAYYQDASWPLEQAQLAKLDHVCRKLELRHGERFLDIGCGWGGLALHAAEKYGVRASGCTISLRQHEYAVAEAGKRGLSASAEFREMDYRDLDGRYDKISSIGMYEHVGRRRLRGYLGKVSSLLDDRGLFLNSGIVRPQTVGNGPDTLFLQQKVFPGTELPHLADVVRLAEAAGLEVVDVENVRLHYALTCRAWVANLERNAEACLKYVDAETYRTWRLYLAASALSFEEGQTDVHQVLMRKRVARGSAARYPADMQPASRVDSGDVALVQIVDAALAEAARKSGPWLVCRPGCTQCCLGPFPITQLDARRLRQGLGELEARDAGRAARVCERARQAVSRMSQGFPGDPVTGLLAEDASTEDWFAEVADDEPCPALDLDSGLCELYAARPMTCRTFGPAVRCGSGSVGICELCFQGASDAEIAACEVEIDPENLESALLEELEKTTGARGQTIVALALAE